MINDENNKPTIKKSRAKYTKEEMRERNKVCVSRYRETHKEKMREISKRYYHNNKEKVKNRIKEYNKNKKEKEKKENTFKLLLY